MFHEAFLAATCLPCCLSCAVLRCRLVLEDLGEVMRRCKPGAALIDQSSPDLCATPAVNRFSAVATTTVHADSHNTSHVRRFYAHQTPRMPCNLASTAQMFTRSLMHTSRRPAALASGAAEQFKVSSIGLAENKQVTASRTSRIERAKRVPTSTLPARAVVDRLSVHAVNECYKLCICVG